MLGYIFRLRELRILEVDSFSEVTLYSLDHMTSISASEIFITHLPPTRE